jgi:hypothetical protein
MTPGGRALTTRREAPMPSAAGTGVESPGRGGTLPCVSQRPVARPLAFMYTSHAPIARKIHGGATPPIPPAAGRERPWNGPSHLPQGEHHRRGRHGSRATPCLSARARRRRLESRNAVDTSAGLSYNAHNYLPLGCSHQRSRSGSMSMNHAQPRLQFTAAPSVRSPACTLFLQRPQLLTRV